CLERRANRPSAPCAGVNDRGVSDGAAYPGRWPEATLTGTGPRPTRSAVAEQGGDPALEGGLPGLGGRGAGAELGADAEGERHDGPRDQLLVRREADADALGHEHVDDGGLAGELAVAGGDDQ